MTGKFRHLPVVENGEVVALLDITKCLYDAIARMERAAEKGNAIAAAVENVEREWSTNSSGGCLLCIIQSDVLKIDDERSNHRMSFLSWVVSVDRQFVSKMPSD